MTPELKAQWIAKLKSGEYKQGKGKLRSKSNQFCCLGVLCDIIDPQGWTQVDFGNYHHKLSSNGNISDLSSGNASNLGLYARTNSYKHTYNPTLYNTLWRMNDEGAKFSDIADFIDKHLPTTPDSIPDSTPSTQDSTPT